MAQPADGSSVFPYLYQSHDAPNASPVAFQILGQESQILQVNLNPGDKVCSEPGAMCYMSAGIEMETTAEGGMMSALQRWIAGESFFANTFINTANTVGYIAFAPPTLSRVVHLDLGQLGGEMLCQKDSYLCSIGDVKVSATLLRRVSVGLFGGEGFVLQRLMGKGLAFISASGTIVQRTLAAGESMVVDAGCTVAISPTVSYQVKYVGSIKRALFGGEGIFYAHLEGPGLCYLQSLPHARYARRLQQAGRAGLDERKPVTSLFNSCFTLLIMVLCVVIPIIVQFVLLYMEMSLEEKDEAYKKSQQRIEL